MIYDLRKLSVPDLLLKWKLLSLLVDPAVSIHPQIFLELKNKKNEATNHSDFFCETGKVRAESVNASNGLRVLFAHSHGRDLHHEKFEVHSNNQLRRPF